MLLPRVIVAVPVLLISVCSAMSREDNHPIKPLGAGGRPLNLDFEDGTLKDWHATGNAFDRQPVRGDTVYPRRHDMHSNHQGNFWIGGFEILGDEATGTLSSAPFKVTHRWASFLVAGGPWFETRVELVRADTGAPFFVTSGYESEELRPVVVDLQQQLGKEIFIRLVDERIGHWGHINFDDFEFYDHRPRFANELKAQTPAPEAPRDNFKYHGVSPRQAAEVMTLPEGFKAICYAGEPDIVQPIAFTIDNRARLWVVEGMTYPQRQPEGHGNDRILIFEDTRGDGKFDKRTVFMDKLNLVSGIEVGFGGVWVGAAPHLMFIPVSDWDHPAPAGTPQILLDGFGWDDTHETLNTFCWGPDGWLYGCHGVFTQSWVGKPGSAKNERVHVNAGIWRYHPTRHVFERFAEGTSNPWGIDFDRNGQIIIEACVIPHLWHVIQGGHFERQAGTHDNPYVYDDIKTIADHVHWVGNKGPHAGNGRSDAAGGGHAHAGLLVYQGGSWPSQFNGCYFMNNIHGARINMDIPEARGSGFVGHHGKDFILFNDEWSQIVNLRPDQDGSIFMIDWYDKNQCHNPNPAAHDRTNGRIFKIVYGNTKTTAVALDKLSDAELVKLQLNRNEWYVREARKVLQERSAAGKLEASTGPALLEIARNDGDELRELRALWALYGTGGLTPAVAIEQLKRSDKPYAQAWTIQLLCEQKHPPTEAIAEFARLAHESASPVVRLYLASACQRMPLEQTWEIVSALLGHAEDAADHNLPLMDWYALEPLAGAHPQRALAIAMRTKLPNILSFTVRRIAAVGDEGAIGALADALSRVDYDAKQLDILKGLNEALRGRRSVAMPKGWDATEAKLLNGSNSAVQMQVAALSVTFGSKNAIDFMRRALTDRSAEPSKRQAAMEALLSAKDPTLATALQRLLDDRHVRGAAVRGLAQYDDANTPRAILDAYPSFDAATQKDALGTLASRPAFGQALLAAIGAGKIPAKDVSADIVRQLRNLHSADIDKRVAQVWGVLRDSPQEKLKRMAQLQQIVERPGPAPDVAHGRVLFNQTCSQCHTLYDTGGHVGPDITGSNRHDLHYLLENVVDPNAIIPNDYRTTMIETKDGRTILGIVKIEDANAVSIQTATELLVIPRNEIQTQRLTPQSMMPEGILDAFGESDIRDLIAYLRTDKQVPLESASSRR